MFTFVTILSLLALFLFFLLVIEKRNKRSIGPGKLKQLQKTLNHLTHSQNYKKALELMEPYESFCSEKSFKPLLTTYLNTLFINEQYEKVLTLISSCACSEPQDPTIELLKAKTLLAQKNYSEALKVFDKCKASLHSADDFLSYAQALFHNQKYTLTLDLIETIPPQHVHDAIYALKGNCHFRLGKFSLALASFERAQKLSSSSKKHLLQIAHSLRHLGRYAQAIPLFEEILINDKTDTSCILGLGACYEALKKYRKALELYQQSCLWKKRHSTVLRQAGICCLHLKRYRFAEVYLRASLNQTKQTLQTLLFLAHCLEKQQKWSEAEKVFFELVKTFPKHVAGYRGLAWLFGVGLSQNVDAQSGISLAKKSLEMLNDPVAWEIVSACEARAGNFSEAHHIQECLSSQSEDKDTRHRRLQAMKSLRKKIPLNETQVTHNLVA